MAQASIKIYKFAQKNFETDLDFSGLNQSWSNWFWFELESWISSSNKGWYYPIWDRLTNRTKVWCWNIKSSKWCWCWYRPCINGDMGLANAGITYEQGLNWTQAIKDGLILDKNVRKRREVRISASLETIFVYVSFLRNLFVHSKHIFGYYDSYTRSQSLWAQF